MREVAQDPERTIWECQSRLDRTAPRYEGQNSNNLGHILSVPFGWEHGVDVNRTKSTLD